MNRPLIPHFRSSVDEDDLRAVGDALRGGHLSDGHVVAGLERDLAAAVPGTHAVAVSSGTAALYLGLLALGLRRGDRVVIPSYTCNSLYAAVALAGGEAVAADLEPGSPALTRRAAEAVWTPAVRALVAPHTFGYLADLDGLNGLGVPVIEDCAHAAGGVFPDGTPVGGKGAIAVFSFFATKTLPAGQGGACVTRDAEIAANLRAWRHCDERPPDPRAFNFVLNDLGAALAARQLARLGGQIAWRERLATRYDRAFGPHAVRASSPSRQAVCGRYLVRVPGDADAFLAAARARGVVCRRPVYRPLHQHLGGTCPTTDDFHAHTVSVPLYPGLTEAEAAAVMDLLPPLLA